MRKETVKITQVDKSSDFFKKGDTAILALTLFYYVIFYHAHILVTTRKPSQE